METRSSWHATCVSRRHVEYHCVQNKHFSMEGYTMFLRSESLWSAILVPLATFLAATTLCCFAIAGPSKIDPFDIEDFNWEPPIGPHLWFEDTGEDDLIDQGGLNPPWVDDGLWGTTFDDFDFGVSNQSSDSYGLIMLLAYKGSGADFSFNLSLGSGSEDFDEGDFESLSAYSIFGGGGNRPGPGEAGIYKTAEGVIFIDLDTGLDSDETVEIDLTVNDPSSLPEDFALHFDVYGFDGQNKVFLTNPASHDLTVTEDGPPVPEASTMILFGSGLIGLLGYARRKVPFLKSR